MRTIQNNMKNLNEKLTTSLPFDSSVMRPGRYIGKEWNSATPDPDQRPRILIAHPDVYEIGMSHYGFQVLYQLLRNQKNISMERAFSLWPDAEAFHRKNKRPLCSLETRTPLSEFDLILFTLPYELSYTNVLAMLDLGGIPLRSAHRTSDHPIIIGGGISTLNPEPVKDFFDAFFVGEGECCIDALMDLVIKHAGRSESHPYFLKSLTELPGFYVPSIHLKTDASKFPLIQKQVLADFDSAPWPSPQLTPFCRPVHERVVVEAGRGCPGQCRFCQARIYYSPVRYRSRETIKKIIREGLGDTGYEEVSLLSLNIADYPDIENLTSELMEELQCRYVSLSLPSLRPERLTPELVHQLSKVRKSGFTLAPEAGTDRLRRIIGKPYNTDRLLQGVAAIFAAGWSSLKLYFMVGQPFETDEDISGIVDLVREIQKIGRSYCGNRFDINISVSTFIPKPHTPFQWMGQASRAILNRRIHFLKDALSCPGIKISYHQIDLSRLEALMTRGDGRMGNVIEEAFRLGCRFEAWNEWFRFDLWNSAFKKFGIDPEEEACHEFPEDAVLPWSMIDAGVSVSDLKQSLEKARKLAQTENSKDSREPARITLTRHRTKKEPEQEDLNQPIFRVLIFHQLMSDFRFYGCRELHAAITRTVCRAGLPVMYTLGYNPRPKFTFPQPAPLGFELLNEPFEVLMNFKMPVQEIVNKLNEQLPREMKVLNAEHVNSSRKKSALSLMKTACIGFELPADAELDLSEYSHRLKIYSRSEYLDTVNQTGLVVPEEYGLFVIFDQNNYKGPKLRDLIQKIYGTGSLPFERYKAARICWNRDQDGGDPWILGGSNS